MKKRILFISLLLGLSITAAAASYSVGVQNHLAQNVVRLHVLANSDSQEDQALKLLVRDRILREGRELFKNNASPSETRSVLADNMRLLTDAAKDEIEKNGFNYSVNIKMGHYNFPMKIYESYAFPSGEYEAVRVEIGEAQGANWWCVMFPPLCFVDAAVEDDKAENAFRESLRHDELDLITTDDGVDIRFKVVDILQSSISTIKTAFTK